MNLENIKKGGARLGLEAELSVQRRSFESYMTKAEPPNYTAALQCAQNCVELLTELIKITGPQPAFNK